MKREFLQNLPFGDAPLSKEAVDAIMAENGRDIEAAKGAFSDYAEVKAALSRAQEELEAMKGQDTESLRLQLKAWEEKYAKAELSHALNLEIERAGGRNQKAILALLDTQALAESENPAEAAKKAVEEIKKDSPYLFFAEERAPLFARGTGAYTGIQKSAPTTLAGALRERFEKERK